MASETIVIESALAPDVAFSRLIDLERVPEWDRGVSESRLVAGRRGELGAPYEVALTGFDGEPTTAMYKITSIGALTFTMVGEHPDFRAEDTITVAAASEGCRVTYDAGLTLVGENPPVSDDRLEVTFAKLVAVVEAGLTSFLAG